MRRSDAFPDHGIFETFAYYEFTPGVWAFDFFWKLVDGTENVYTYGFWSYQAGLQLVYNFQGLPYHTEPTGGICYNLNIRGRLVQVNGQDV